MESYRRIAALFAVCLALRVVLNLVLNLIDGYGFALDMLISGWLTFTTAVVVLIGYCVTYPFRRSKGYQVTLGISLGFVAAVFMAVGARPYWHHSAARWTIVHGFFEWTAIGCAAAWLVTALEARWRPAPKAIGKPVIR